MQVKPERITLISVLIILICATCVQANAIAPWYQAVFQYMWMFLIIPIILLETFVGILTVKAWFKNKEIKLYAQIAFFILIANIISTVVGGMIFSFVGVNPSGSYSCWWEYPGVVLWAYVVTVIVEFPIIIYPLVKKRDRFIRDGLIFTIIINTISYLIILLPYVLTNGS